MTKKQTCMNYAPLAVMALSNTIGVAIHHIDYGIDDYVYASVGGGDAYTYHRCKVYYKDIDCGNCEAFFYIGKMKLNMSDFMRV